MAEAEANEVNGQGVTISVSLRIEPGRESEFDEFLDGITAAAEEFPGFMSVQAYRPTRGRGRYRVLLRFDSEGSLQRWRESDCARSGMIAPTRFPRGRPASPTLPGPLKSSRWHWRSARSRSSCGPAFRVSVSSCSAQPWL